MYSSRILYIRSLMIIRTSGLDHERTLIYIGRFYYSDNIVTMYIPLEEGIYIPQKLPTQVRACMRVVYCAVPCSTYIV